MERSIPLSSLTTIKLGGPAQVLVRCASVEDIRSALDDAHKHRLPVAVLGGGSNTIFQDKGFGGLVLRVELRGVSFQDDGDDVLATVRAGENWDAFVTTCVANQYVGIEALSGIPGSVGATPIQNVGAYGQEVRAVIVSVTALDRQSGSLVTLENAECRFGYRTSRFKTDDLDRYIITDVVYRLQKSGIPELRYPQVQARFRERFGDGAPTVEQVRSIVRELRKKKSMIVDPKDPNSVSCGSFFVNPVLDPEEFSTFMRRAATSSVDPATIPVFSEGVNKKVSAAWLVEHAGFQKGYRYHGVAISDNHSLVLVNRSGTTHDLLVLAHMISDAVYNCFGLTFVREPVVYP